MAQLIRKVNAARCCVFTITITADDFTNSAQNQQFVGKGKGKNDFTSAVEKQHLCYTRDNFTLSILRTRHFGQEHQ
jgi:hypothetical protein